MPALVVSRDAYLGLWLGLINDQIEHGAQLRRDGEDPNDDAEYRARSAFIDRIAAQAPGETH